MSAHRVHSPNEAMTAGDDACFEVRADGTTVTTVGATHFFRGHTVESGAADRPDGIYAEWSWDGRRLVARNDRYGASPLFYVDGGGSFAISPSLLTLIARGAPTAIDESALAVFLRLGFFLGDDTPFTHIHAAPPNATLIWEGGRLSVNGDYTYPRVQHVSRDQALDGFIALVHQAIARRLPAGDDAILPLSGGRDSRHILFELCALGRPPRECVTIPRYPPRPHEDERIAPIVAREAGVRHALLPQDGSRLDAEVRKNWGTHLCADEHAWYMGMIASLCGRASAIYDGLGGALSVPSRFLSRQVLDLFDAGRTWEIAERLLASFALYDESCLDRIVGPEYRHGLSRARALERLSRELARHTGTPDPVKSFNFWNRIRRELALVPYALMKDVPAVYSPYLDHGVYDFMMGLPATVMSPDLASADKSFHSDAIHRAFPQYSHIPFEDKAAPKVDPREHHARFVADVTRYVLRHARAVRPLVNSRYLVPRLLYGLGRKPYRADRPWLASLPLYLTQVQLAANRMAA